MTISSQTLCFEARRKCGVGVIHTQLASSHANAPQKLASSPSTVGFITRDFHALISRQHWQTNRRGLYTLFLTSKYRCMQKISSVDALLTTQNVLSWSGRFGGGHTGWSQLQLASSVSPLWLAYLLPLPLAQLPQQKTPFKLAVLYNKSIADAHPSFLLKEAILVKFVSSANEIAWNFKPVLSIS